MDGPIVVTASEQPSKTALSVLKEAAKKSGTSPVFTNNPDDPLEPSTRKASCLIRLGTSSPVSSCTSQMTTYSLRELETRPDAVSMMTRILTTASWIGLRPTSSEMSTRWILAKTRMEVLQWVMSLPPGSTIYLDVETQGDVSLLHPSQRRLLSLALSTKVRGFVTPPKEKHATLVVPEELLQESWPELIDTLGAHELGAHNGKFDLSTLCLRLGAALDDLRLSYDTLLMHYVLHPAAGSHKLKDLVYSYFGVEDWGFPDAVMKDLASQPRDELYTYNALDAIHGKKLLGPLHNELQQDPDARYSLRVRMHASELFQWMEPQGIGFDVFYVRDTLQETLSTRAEQARGELAEMAHRVLPRTRTVHKQRSKTTKDPDTGEKHRAVWKEPVEQDYEFNPGSPQQLLKLYQAGGITLPDTSKQTMEYRMVKEGDTFAEMLLSWRKTSKQLTAFVTPLLERANDVLGPTLLFPSYKIHGTKSSRLSAEHPNVQQMPRDPAIRRAFRARGEDRLLVEVDYGQGELRVIAAEAEDEWLLSLFRNPEVDVFTQMLPVVFPRIDFTSIGKDRLKELRAKLKGVIYGLNFGRGAAAIAHEIGSTVQEAKRIIDTFFAHAVGVGQWRSSIMYKAVYRQPIRTRLGSRFQFEVITPENMKSVQRSALSHVPQGNLSDMNLLSACRVRHHIKDHGKDWYIAALVHDANLLDVPKDEASDAAHVVSSIMESTAKATFPEVPFAVDAKYGYTWADTA